MIVFFFSLIKTALEVKARTTYEELTASGQVFVKNVGSDDEDAGSARDKGQSQRYGKKCLLFLGDPRTLWKLLVWSVFGDVVMIIHYRF